jgi:hypothetical protein
LIKTHRNVRKSNGKVLIDLIYMGVRLGGTLDGLNMPDQSSKEISAASQGIKVFFSLPCDTKMKS